MTVEGTITPGAGRLRRPPLLHVLHHALRRRRRHRRLARREFRRDRLALRDPWPGVRAPLRPAGNDADAERRRRLVHRPGGQRQRPVLLRDERALYGYDLLGGSLAFTYEFGSLGECPIRASFSTDPATLYSYYLFDGNACLLLDERRVRRGGHALGRPDRRVNAYPPGAIHALTTVAGFDPLRYQATWSDGNEAVTITETDSLMLCSPPGPIRPTTSSCPTLSPAGGSSRADDDAGADRTGCARHAEVHRHRSDARHSLDLLFSQSVQAPATGEVPGFEFPGQPVFATPAPPILTPRSPPAPGTIYVIANCARRARLANPIGAITYGATAAGATSSAPRVRRSRRS